MTTMNEHDAISQVMGFHNLSDEQWDQLSVEQKSVRAKEAGITPLCVEGFAGRGNSVATWGPFFSNYAASIQVGTLRRNLASDSSIRFEICEYETLDQ